MSWGVKKPCHWCKRFGRSISLPLAVPALFCYKLSKGAESTRDCCAVFRYGVSRMRIDITDMKQ